MVFGIRSKLGRLGAPIARDWETEWLRVVGCFRNADVALFHQFEPPPGGGGHQFLRALSRELTARGLRLENNTLSASTQSCLCNSFNFDLRRFRRLYRRGCRVVHRVDGPVGMYRGRDDGIDRGLATFNREFAAATVFQSQYSLDEHVRLGLEFAEPVVIRNAVDPSVFNSSGRAEFSRDRQIRLVTTCWSDNPNKGTATYEWLDRNLDFSRFDYTFIGRSTAQFRNVRVVAPVPSAQLADLLRESDVFIWASLHESCSNSLTEAMACGLPSVYVRSGSNEEVAGSGGIPFESPEAIPDCLDRLVAEYECRQASISVPALSEVAGAYLRVLRLGEGLND